MILNDKTQNQNEAAQSTFSLIRVCVRATGNDGNRPWGLIEKSRKEKKRKEKREDKKEKKRRES